MLGTSRLPVPISRPSNDYIQIMSHFETNPPSVGVTSENDTQFPQQGVNIWNLDYLERVILPLLDIQAGAWILDAGCGDGSMTLMLARLLPTAYITGVDPDPRAVADAWDAAVAMRLNNVGFRAGDSRQLPFAAATVDVVTCQLLLNHVPDASEVVAEMARVLRPGGTFMVVEGHATGVPLYRDNLFPHRDESWHLDMFRLQRLYLAGKKALGRGDSTVGGHLPFLMMAAGIEVREIRLNDRPGYAFPPYGSQEKKVVAARRQWLSSELPGQFRQQIAEAILAGGGSQADVVRYFQLAHDPAERQTMRQAIDQGTFAFLESHNIHIFIGSKK